MPRSMRSLLVDGFVGMPMIDIVWVLAVMFFASFVQSIGGFGFALLAVPLAALIVDLELAVIAVSIGSLFNVIILSLRTRRDVNREVAVRFNVAALLGMPIGVYVLETTPQRPLKVALGAVIILATLALIEGTKRLQNLGSSWPSPKRVVEITAGWISGVLSTATGTNGPPLVLALNLRRLQPDVFRATLAITFAVSGAVSMMFFVAFGMVTRQAVLLASAAVPLILAGQAIGLRVQPRLSEKRFDRLVYVLLLASGISVAMSGLLG